MRGKDASAMTAAKGDAVAGHLAERKALAVSARHPEAIGPRLPTRSWSAKDRLVQQGGGREGGGRHIASAARAARRIDLGRGDRERGSDYLALHRCRAAANARFLGRISWRTICAAEVPDILGSVGCYRIEGRGAQLFARMEGDQFTIRGLPLIPLLAALREHGALDRHDRRGQACRGDRLAGAPVGVACAAFATGSSSMGSRVPYVALPIEPANFGRCVATLPLMGFAGASVTVPHKEAAFALASSLDEDAARDRRGEHARVQWRSASPA